MQKYHDEPKQYKGYLKSALIAQPAGPAIYATDAPKAPTDGSSATRTKPRWIGWRIASRLGPR